MEHLDGNVLAGPTADLFAFDATTAPGQCISCGEVATLAQAMVYGQPMGYVARCRTCDNVLAVVIERPDQTSLAMRGLRWLRTAQRAS